MFENINLFYFILAFSVGMLYIYITNPEPRVVLKFPSPYNAGEVTYRDQSNSCYKYKADKTSCPLDKSAIKPQPIVEDFKKQA